MQKLLETYLALKPSVQITLLLSLVMLLLLVALYQPALGSLTTLLLIIKDLLKGTSSSSSRN